MKRGVTLYVSTGKEELPDWMDLGEQRKLLQADDLCVATSEADINHHWWRLLVRGMHHISCMRAEYDETRQSLEPCGTPMRLYG